MGPIQRVCDAIRHHHVVATRPALMDQLGYCDDSLLIHHAISLHEGTMLTATSSLHIPHESHDSCGKDCGPKLYTTSFTFFPATCLCFF